MLKHAVSISLGSPSRDKKVEVELLGETVCLERIGTNGDEKKAKAMYEELDGKVDAFGIGGITLHIYMPWKNYPLYYALKLVEGINKTPYTDGRGLQKVLESRVMQYAEKKIGSEIKYRKAFLVEAASRHGMLVSFANAGFECVYGDLMFALGIPIPIKTLKRFYSVVRVLLPIVGRLPISMLYSTGESQEVVKPRYEKYYKESSVIAGDWLYIKKHMPDDMEGKIIVTNTTTRDDVDFMRKRGIKYLVTTTPIFDGRSFGTNATEAALIAAAGKGRRLSDEELEEIIEKEGIEPHIEEITL